MADINDGGPAFPQSASIGDRSCTTGGMSLRDWFAGQVLAGITANPAMTFHKNEIMAANAYAVADAMLHARDVSDDSFLGPSRPFD